MAKVIVNVFFVFIGEIFDSEPFCMFSNFAISVLFTANLNLLHKMYIYTIKLI